MTPAEAQRAKARRAGAALDALAQAVTDRAAVTPPCPDCGGVGSGCRCEKEPDQ